VVARRSLDVAGILEKSGWILVAAGAASGRKRWPVECFTEVIRTLHEKTGKKVLLVGTLDERPVAESILAKLPGIVVVLCGDLVLPETAALIAKASLVIANDSAIMHLGFELGVPTVGIFGPTDHEKYGHAGPKFRVAREDARACSCGSEKLPRAERSCFHGLKPEKVIALCLELLNA
jgi:ADP-heptose:LPS heptosyltransferase